MSHWTVAGCPSEDDIAAFLGNAFEADERRAFERHLDACRGCRGVVAEMVRVFASSNAGAASTGNPVTPEAELNASSSSDSGSHSSADSGAGESAAHPIGIGTTVGRYRILEVLGMGGMGIVYAAHDPELDRKVALKVLRSHGDHSDERSARLVREARAMARLSHPNVIAVHDVGTWHGRVFVAMEFVEGGTLKDWLRGRTRSWTSIWPMLLAAGRGLAAAHEAGFVHRDFKPDNVLVSDGGRVFVTDFGLARWAEANTLESDSTRAVLDEEHAVTTAAELLTDAGGREILTKSGVFVGTPAYMAPEQFLRQRVDAACDQFAFCVVLWEALFGERPFGGRTLTALAAEVCESELPAFPGSAKIPRRVRTALVRGLAKRPAERYPSMSALLEVLGPPRRAWLPWATAGAVTALGVPALLLATGREGPPVAVADARCEGLEGVGGAWTDSHKAALAGALRQPGTPFAKDASQRVVTSLDAFVDAFAAAERALCEATEAGELDPTRVALRRRCLDERRDMFADVETALESADGRMVERAVQVTATLPAPEDCTDDARLQVDVLPPPPPAILIEVESVRRALRAAEADRSLGRYEPALESVEAEQERARSLRFRPLNAELGYLRGRLLQHLGRFEEAAQTLERAELDATASHHTQIAARAALLRVSAIGRSQEDWAQVESAIERARAAVDAADATSKTRAAMHSAVAVAASRMQRTERAIAEYQRALTLLDPKIEPLEWARASLGMASEQRRRGAVEASLPTVRHAIEIYARELGPNHPDLIEPYRELGVALKNLEQFAEARKAVHKGLEITAASRGATSYVYGGMLSSLSGVEGEAGNLEEALGLAERSAQILAAASQSTLIPDSQRAEWLVRLKRPDEAAPIVDAILAGETKRLGPDSPGLAWVYFVRAGLEAARKDVDATRVACDRAIELTPVEPDSDDALTLVLDRAVHLADAGGNAEALASLRGSSKALEAAAVSPTTARMFRELGVRAWEAGEPERARADMRRAASQFSEIGLVQTGAEVDAWLKEHAEPAEPSG